MTTRRPFDFHAAYRAALRKLRRERPVQPSGHDRELQKFIDRLVPATSESKGDDDDRISR